MSMTKAMLQGLSDTQLAQMLKRVQLEQQRRAKIGGSNPRPAQKEPQ